MDYKEFLKEVEKRRTPENSDPDQSLMDVARWFAAITITREALENYRLKDWGHIIMNGGQVGDVRTGSRLKKWFEESKQGFMDDEAAFDEWLIKELDSHFRS